MNLKIIKICLYAIYINDSRFLLCSLTQNRSNMDSVEFSNNSSNSSLIACCIKSKNLMVEKAFDQFCQVILNHVLNDNDLEQFFNQYLEMSVACIDRMIKYLKEKTCSGNNDKNILGYKQVFMPPAINIFHDNKQKIDKKNNNRNSNRSHNMISFKNTLHYDLSTFSKMYDILFLIEKLVPYGSKAYEEVQTCVKPFHLSYKQYKRKVELIIADQKEYHETENGSKYSVIVEDLDYTLKILVMSMNTMQKSLNDIKGFFHTGTKLNSALYIHVFKNNFLKDYEKAMENGDGCSKIFEKYENFESEINFILFNLEQHHYNRVLVMENIKLLIENNNQKMIFI